MSRLPVIRWSVSSLEVCQGAQAAHLFIMGGGPYSQPYSINRSLLPSIAIAYSFYFVYMHQILADFPVTFSSSVQKRTLFNLCRLVGKPTMWFPNRSDTNGPVQAQKMARSLKFWINKIEELYYACGENKGADQLRSYCEADLRLCFRLCRLLVFPWGGSFLKNL